MTHIAKHLFAFASALLITVAAFSAAIDVPHVQSRRVPAGVVLA